MSTQSAESTDFDSRWWLSTQGKAEGPYSKSYVLAALMTNSIPAATYACPIGGTEWKLISDWPTFVEAVGSIPVVALPNPASQDDSPLTNPRLPTVANWICIYAIVVSPALWVFATLSSFASGFSYREESRLFPIECLLTLLSVFVSFILTLLVMYGGLQLRSLRPIGPTIIKAVILTNLAIGFLIFAIAIGFALVASENDLAASTPAGEVISFFSIFIALVDMAFEIMAVIWLFRNSKVLPLSNS